MSDKRTKGRFKSLSKKVRGKKKKIIFNINDNKRVFSEIIDFRELGSHRFHLRILQSGKAILSIDAKYVLYLNQIAMLYFKDFIKKKSLKETQDNFVKHFRTTKEEVADDYKALLDKVEVLFTTEDACPFTELGFSERTPFKVTEFPLRVDLALTYRCNNACSHCYVARERDFPELKTHEMIKVLDELWKVGVPHVAFTGGDPTMREDLMVLIEHAQQKGFVTGVITNGRKFKDAKLVKEAIEKGLDYAQITLESHLKDVHDKMVGVKGAFEDTIQAIKNFEKEDIFLMTNTTLCKHNIETIEDTIKFLKNDLNIEVFACNGLIFSGKGKEYEDFIEEKALEPVLRRIDYLARKLEMRFIWYSPTQYCSLNPVEIGLGPKRCSAANISIAIEPNGDVLPCQSYYEPVGNILKDKWEKIWYSELFEKIRNKEYIEPKCKECDLLQVCGGGCPLFIEKEKLRCKVANF